MKLSEHKRARPNLAGLTSPVQQTEMKLLLAGGWPPLKPLPVFKYEADEYRASIDFDKMRGEWVCHKTSLPSNKVQEFRGGLTEITMALPHSQAEEFAACAAIEPQEQELEKDASRRRQAIIEWRENYENGALYSGLEDYLSESQRDEIDDSIRLTLTARQLQFSPKNVAYVFDALSKAGGRLATLIEIARRNKRGRGAEAPAKAEAAASDAERHGPVETMHPTRDRRRQIRTTPVSRAHVELGDAHGGVVLNISETGMAVAATDPLVLDDYLPSIRFPLPGSGQNIEMSAQIVWLAESKKSAGIRFVDLSAEARNQISNWILSEKPAPELEGLRPAPVESRVPETLENAPEEPMGGVLRGPDQASSPELIARTASPASRTATPEILGANPPSFAEDLQEKVHRRAPAAGFGPRVRSGELKSRAHRIENSPARPYVLEISGFQVAVVVVLFAVISLTVGLTAGRGLLGMRFEDTEKSIPAADAASPATLNHPGETTSRTATPPAANMFHSPRSNRPAPATERSQRESPSAQSLNARPTDSAARVGPSGPSSAISPGPHGHSDNSEASREPKDSTGLITRNAPANSAPRGARPATGAAPHLSSPSTMLVSGPGDGSKPFRLTLPEKPIAASSSFAMTSQLSVLVPAEPGLRLAHKPARLQAGELVSFVWPLYPRPGDRHGSSETVKVRTTIGELGQVLEVKHLSGSISLLPAATSAIRQWRYKPTLLNSRPVQAQQDVTIEFRPPQPLPRVPARHPSHN